MAVKTVFTHSDFQNILARYDLGTFTQAESVQQGTVQTNYFITTSQGKFVFRCYENRSRESVLFESDLLAYLIERGYPCPAQIKNTQGTTIGTYQDKPYVFSEFLDGVLIKHPSLHHMQQLVQKAAELQAVTRDFRSQYTPYRWNYGRDLCRRLARKEATKLNTKDAQEKFNWLDQELTLLDLPAALPKGICHCDFHFSNVLFRGGKFAALLDFDDANYTFLQFDLVCLIGEWAWPYTSDRIDITMARAIVQEYIKHRPLTLSEQKHLYDVYKLSILIDCIWFFRRGAANDFYEKRKINALTRLGREYFFEALFHN